MNLTVQINHVDPPITSRAQNEPKGNRPMALWFVLDPCNPNRSGPHWVVLASGDEDALDCLLNNNPEITHNNFAQWRKAVQRADLYVLMFTTYQHARIISKP